MARRGGSRRDDVLADGNANDDSVTSPELSTCEQQFGTTSLSSSKGGLPQLVRTATAHALPLEPFWLSICRHELDKQALSEIDLPPVWTASVDWLPVVSHIGGKFAAQPKMILVQDLALGAVGEALEILNDEDVWDWVECII